MSMLDLCPETTPSGKVVLIATITAKPGKEARLQELLLAAQKHALSDKEPRTHTYRVTRAVDKDGKHTSAFIVIEEYDEVKVGFKDHTTGPPLIEMAKAFKEEDVLAIPPVLTFCDEL